MHMHTIGVAKCNSLSNLLSAWRKSVKFQSSTQFYAVCPTLNGTMHTGYIGATNFYYHIDCFKDSPPPHLQERGVFTIVRMGRVLPFSVNILLQHQYIVNHIHLLGQSDYDALLVLIELYLSTTDELGN